MVAFPQNLITRNLGYYKIARGQDDRPVEPNRIRKSIGAENSFAKDLSDRVSMLLELEQIAQTVKLRLDQHQTGGRTLTLNVSTPLDVNPERSRRVKVKFSDYQQITRSKTVLTPIRELSAIRL